MMVVAPQSLKANAESTARGFDPKLLSEGRKEEMEYMRKMEVFEVVDEKERYDNGCKPLMLKWADKMKRREMSFKIGVSGDQEGQRQR